MQPSSHLPRLAALQQLGLVERELAPAFDRLTRFAAKLVRTPVALIVLVDADRQRCTRSLGLPESWAPDPGSLLSHAFCQHIMTSSSPLMVEDARSQPLVGGQPARSDLGVVAYARVPLCTRDGHLLGAVCAIDTTPRAWTEAELDDLRQVAALVMTEIELRRDILARTHEERLALQYEVTRVLVEAEGLDTATATMLRIIGETLHWEVGLLWLIDPHAAVLRCQQVWQRAGRRTGEFEARSRVMTFRAGVGLPGRVWASGQAMWIGDVRTDGNFPRLASAAQEGLHSAFGFPARSSQGLVGVVEFFSAQIRLPDDDLLAMVTALGHQIGQFIERQRVQEDLRASEARKAAILESALDCIISIDHTGRITEFNPAAEHTFGYRREEALGQELAELIVPAHLREAHRRGLAHYLATGEGPVLGRRIELSAVRADGTEFPIELAITRIAIDGPPMFTGYIRDLTAHKRAEQERAELLRREQAARVEAERALRLRNEFLSIAAHELRTPITALQGYTELLQRRVRRGAAAQPADARTGQAVQVIHQQAQRLARLVDQLLDISRIETSRFTLTWQAVDLCLLVRRVVESLEAALARHTIEFHCAVEMLVIDGDELRLEQVVHHLLHNAIKYSPDGGVIRISLGRHDEDATLVISDQGIGIPATAQPHLFQRFYRAENVDATNVSGFGLGLYIVHEIVSRHGGTISVRSVEGEGSSFTIHLPVRRAAGVTTDS